MTVIPSFEAADVDSSLSGDAAPALLRLKLSPADAAGMVFSGAKGEDFYPLLVESPDVGDGVKLTLQPVPIGDLARHAEFLRSAGESKTFWNLCSYRSTAIRPRGFTWKKDFVRGLHGVFIDFDCGRREGDPGFEAPGRLLTQGEVWDGVVELIRRQVLPPFQLWAEGTRGCYGVILFEKPENVFEAAETWKRVREYFYGRAKHLAADELARAITQPLKAPGACGVVQYYATGAPRTSLDSLERWLRDHPHDTDPAEGETAVRGLTVAQQQRLDRLGRKVSVSGRSHPSSHRRAVTWKQKAGWTKARADDMQKYVAHFRRTGFSRRQFFYDLASAVKAYEYARVQDARDAYSVALQVCEEVNALLDHPLPSTRLQEQVHAADPRVHRSSEAIRLDMRITAEIAEYLQLRALLPEAVKREKRLVELEQRAIRAEARAEAREQRNARAQAAKETRAHQRQARAASKNAKAVDPEKSARLERIRAIEQMLREGAATGEITRATGAHRQQVARVRARLIVEGHVLPEQRTMKHGRRPEHVTECSGPRGA